MNESTQPAAAEDEVERVREAISHVPLNFYDDEPLGMNATRGDVIRIARAAIAGMRPEQQWQPIETAPYRTAVRVLVGDMTFEARLMPGASENADGSCDQWQAVHEGEHPPCWSGGACWESNEGEVSSLQPTHWQHLAACAKQGGE